MFDENGTDDSEYIWRVMSGKMNVSVAIISVLSLECTRLLHERKLPIVLVFSNETMLKRKYGYKMQSGQTNNLRSLSSVKIIDKLNNN